MPHNNKDRKSRPLPQNPSIKAKRKKTTGRRQIIFISCIFAVLVIVVVGAFYYGNNIAPMRRAVMTVDGKVIRMDYFLKRAKLMGADTTSVLQQLIDEEIVRLEVPELGIQVSEADLDAALRQAAAASLVSSGTDTTTSTTTTTAAPITDDEFNKWYRQQIDQSGLSESEFREITRVRLMAAGIQQYLNQNIPASAEQVHLNVILTASLADAHSAKGRIAAGESFADVARSVSLDTSKDNGGDLSWVPKGVYGHEDVTFSLPIGKVSDPIAVDSSNPDSSEYLLFMVSEKAAERAIDETRFRCCSQT